MDDFEWELSKENVKPLPGGRSVELLNKVLSTQHSREFQQRRQHMRQHFELKISHLPASFVKLRLYARYMRWVEQNYPCLGRSADLETLLYRCVRDVGQLAAVQNDQDFVEVWIRLTEYCAQPAELFELLFRQGVGTMCTKFYVAWASVLESRGNYQRCAAVYAHGLRARAKPLFWLEDRSELFLSRYAAYQAQSAEQDQFFTSTAITPTDSSRTAVPINPTERQKLAALRLVESRGTDENAADCQLQVPVMRTAQMWHPSQTGLGQSCQTGRTQPPCPRVRIAHARDQPESVDSRLLHTLAPLPQPDPTQATVDLLRPLGKPSQWQKENCPKPKPWKNEQIDLSKLMPGSSGRVALPSWEIYSEEAESGESVPNGSISPSNTEPVGRNKAVPRKGLAVLHSTDVTASAKSLAPRLTVPVFEVLFDSSPDADSFHTVNPVCSNQASSTETHASADRVEMLQQLNFPSLPAGRLPSDAEFSIPLHLIYGGAEEMCWEMHRAVHKERAPVQRVTAEQALMSAWQAEEQKLIEELEQLELETEEAPRLPDDGPTEFQSTRLKLIKSLESIALSAAR